MKKILFFAISALSVLACTKEEPAAVVEEEQPITFTASIDEGESKTTVDASTGRVEWKAGDEITITRTSDKATGVYYIASDSDITTHRVATFTYKSGTSFSGEGTYDAAYGDVKNQWYDSTKPGSNCPMAATATTVGATGSFIFTNTCGIVAVSANTGSVAISKILIGTTSLNFPTPVALNGTYSVAVPAGEAFTTVAFVKNDGSAASKTIASASVAVNQIRNLKTGTYFAEPTYYSNFEPKALKGVFTVSSAGKKVLFSAGNVCYDGSIWACESNQYDYRTYEPYESYISVSSTATTETPEDNWGLFGWVNETGNALNDSPLLYGKSISSSYPYYTNYGTGDLYLDWGKLTVSKNWYTLSKDEWDYLLNNRKVTRNIKSTLTSGSSYQYTSLTLQDKSKKNVLIILPDNYAGTIDGTTDVSSSTSWAQWQMLESMGCALLPVHFLYRSGTACSTPYYGSAYTPYWTSSHYGVGGTDSYAMAIHGSTCSNMAFHVYYGACVRLVKTY